MNTKSLLNKIYNLTVFCQKAIITKFRLLSLKNTKLEKNTNLIVDIKVGLQITLRKREGKENIS